jgi:hypothetical protein
VRATGSQVVVVVDWGVELVNAGSVDSSWVASSDERCFSVAVLASWQVVAAVASLRAVHGKRAHRRSAD